MARSNVGEKTYIWRLLWERENGQGGWFTTQWWDYHEPGHPAMLAKIEDVKRINRTTKSGYGLRHRVLRFALDADITKEYP